MPASKWVKIADYLEEEAELRQLREENKQLKAEREGLRSALERCVDTFYGPDTRGERAGAIISAQSLLAKYEEQPDG